MYVHDILKALQEKGLDASYGDSDFETIISWEDVYKISDALADHKDELVIRPGAGGTIIYPKE